VLRKELHHWQVPISAAEAKCVVSSTRILSREPPKFRKELNHCEVAMRAGLPQGKVDACVRILRREPPVFRKKLHHWQVVICAV